jgi:hypothetical protein
MTQISAAARAVLDEVSASFQLSDPQMVSISNAMVEEFNAGLKENGRPVSMV